MNNIITPKILTNGIKCIKKACNKAPGISKVSCTEGVDKFIKTTDKLEKIEMKKPYVKPNIKVISAESDSQMLASSDNGNHYGWDNGNGNGHGNGNGNGHGHGNGHGRGNDYDDDSYGWDD